MALTRRDIALQALNVRTANRQDTSKIDPFRAAGSALREGFVAAGEGAQTLGQGVESFYLNWRERQKQKELLENVRPEYKDRFAQESGMKTEEQLNQEQFQAVAQVAGGGIKLGASAVFAPVSASYELVKNWGQTDQGQGILGPVFTAMDTSMEFITNALTPNEEGAARGEGILNEWVDKISDELYSKVFAGGFELVSGEGGEVRKDGQFNTDDIGNFYYKTFVEEVLAEAMPVLGLIGTFKGVEVAGKKAFTRMTKAEKLEAVKGMTVKDRIEVFNGKDKLDARVLSEMEAAVRRGDSVTLKDMEIMYPKNAEAFAKTKKSSSLFAKVYKGILEKAKKGAEITLAEKRTLVDQFAKAFKTEKTSLPHVNELVSRIEGSPTKVEYYNQTMREFTTSAMAHPDFMNSLEGFSGTMLKKKPMSDLRNPDKYAQLSGGKDFSRPTGEDAARQFEQTKNTLDAAKSTMSEGDKRIGEAIDNIARAESRLDSPESRRQVEVDSMATSFGKYKKVIPGLDSMDLPAAINAAEARMLTNPTPTLQEFLDTFKRFDEMVGEKFGEGADAAEVFAEIKERNTEFRLGESTPVTEQSLRADVDKANRALDRAIKMNEAVREPVKNDFFKDIKPERLKELAKDPIVGEVFRPDEAPLTTWDYVVRGMRGPVIEKIVKGDAAKELARRASEHQADVSKVSHVHAGIEEVLLQEFTPTSKPKNIAQKAWERLSKKEEAAFLRERGREIFDAIEAGKIGSLTGKTKEVAERITSDLAELRTELKQHTMEMVQKMKEHNIELQEQVDRYSKWLRDNKDAISRDEANAVSNLIKEWENVIETRGLEMERETKSGDIETYWTGKIGRDLQSIERLENASPNYIPHIVDPVMRNFTREHMPDVYEQLGMALNGMDNRFLKERVDFPFYMRNAVEAYAKYKLRAVEQLSIDKAIADAYQNAVLQGYVRGTPKGEFLHQYVNERLEGKVSGREAVVPTLEPIYDAIYGAAKKADMKADLKVLSKLVEETRLINQEQYQYLKDNATDFSKLDIKPIEDGVYELTVQTLKPDMRSYDKMLTAAKMQMYSGTIGMSPRTTVMNVVSQPLVAAAHSGFPTMEALSIMAKETKEAISLLRKKDFRDQMEDTGMSPTQRQVLNPEGGVGREASTAYGRFIDFSLSNMRYTELVARYTAGRIGYLAYEKGLISKDMAGDIVEVNGKKLAKGYSDTFNFEYTQDTAPSWVETTVGGLPVGRAIYTLSSFGQKNLELHGKLFKNADFKDWLRQSKKIYEDKNMNGAEKFANIYEAYRENAFRIGLAKEAAFGLAAAIVLGQVFDLDWDEFLTGSVGFGLSNPITNLFMGAGSFSQGLGGKLKPFVPFRGAVRGIDKTLGTDIISDYKDYGNVPKLLDLLKSDE